jgi:hypothetical protein
MGLGSVKTLDPSNITDHLLRIEDKNDTFGLLSFRIRINGEQDFKYAKYLYELHFLKIIVN